MPERSGDPLARWSAEIRRRLKGGRVSDAGESAIVEELAQHLEDRYRDCLARGMAENEAMRRTLEELESDGAPGLDLVEPLPPRPAPVPPPAGAPGRWLSALAGDARYAVRVLLRDRAFAAVAVLTLAIGVGANTAIFSVVNGLLLRPLPYPDAERLVFVVGPGLITPANIGDWRAGVRAFDRMAGWGMSGGVLGNAGAARRLSIMVADDDFLPLLGARPVLGRLWGAGEGGAGDTPIAVIAQHLAHDVFGENGDPIGRAITVDGVALTVIGVLPHDFHNLGYAGRDAWVPLAQRPQRTLSVVARLRPGATLQQARTEAGSVAERVEATPLAADFGRTVRLHDLRELFTGEMRQPVLILFAAAGLVLLLACANLTNLLLSRAAGRRRELAIRSALGAGRGALLRQLLVEGTVLAVSGALCGLLLAWWSLRSIVAMLPPELARLPAGAMRIDITVLAFTLGTALLATLLAGIAPSLAGLSATQGATGTARATPPRSARLWREALITAEVAMALVLVIGTTLLVRTYVTLRPTSPGYETRDRLVVSLGLHDDGERNIEIVRRLTRDIEQSIPGARAAAANQVPLSGMAALARLQRIDGEALPAPGPGERTPMLDVNAVTPDYLDVIGMRVVEGRGLDDADRGGTQPVVVVNRSAARRLWPDAGSVLGRRLTLDLFGTSTELTVVGVVADARTSGLSTSSRAQAIVSYWQLPWPGLNLVVHVPADSRPDAAMLRRLVATVDPTVPVGEPVMLATIAARAVRNPRYQTTLMSGFGVIALLLAVIGCYGVLAYSVNLRTREFGVRIALGATPAAILSVVLRRAVLLVLAGLVLGIALAAAATRVLEGSLYGVKPTDPATFAFAAAALLAVSLLAAYLPASRAASVDPVVALRYE